MRISVSSYSFHQYLSSGRMTQLDCIAKAKEMGFEGIEFTDLSGETLEEQKEYAAQIRKKADEVGIDICAYTVGASLFRETEEEMQEEVERLKGQLEVAKILGAPIMRHDTCWQLTKTGKGRSFDLMLPDLANSCRQITEYGQSLGIVTCSENHGQIGQDSDRMERLFNAVNHDNYGLLIDTGNFACVDEDPALAVSRLAPYAVHVHAKELYIRDEEEEHCDYPTRGGKYLGGAVIGEGDIPVKQCMRILRRAGYDGFVSIEYEAAEDCMTGIARALVNLKKMISE